jgi:hypothetical protein
MKYEEKYKKEVLEHLIFNDKLSYREIGRRYNVSDTYIKKICKILEINLPKRSNFPENWSPHNKGKKNKKICINCQNEYFSLQKESKYCTKQCEIDYKVHKKYEHYLNNQNEYERIIHTKFLKRHILKEQNNCCEICKMKNEWNQKPIVFIIDHINGDASNNRRENLRLICPNCDSQLGTFKSKNKNSARKERYILNYKNKIN